MHLVSIFMFVCWHKGLEKKTHSRVERTRVDKQKRKSSHYYEYFFLRIYIFNCEHVQFEYWHFPFLLRICAKNGHACLAVRHIICRALTETALRKLQRRKTHITKQKPPQHKNKSDGYKCCAGILRATPQTTSQILLATCSLPVRVFLRRTVSSACDSFLHM